MTLLPNKHVPTNRSLLGIGAFLLQQLEFPQTVSGLWEMVRNDPTIGSFDNFVLSLDYLFIIGAISYHNGSLLKSQRC